MNKKQTTQTTETIETLLHVAQRALLSGDMYEARKQFREVTDQYPTHVEGWLGLADSVLPYRDKREHLQRALMLDPDNQDVQQRLSDVERKIAAGEVLAPKPAPSSSNTARDDSNTPQPSPDDATIELDHCYRHPKRETGLHCIQCGKAICAQCAKQSVVGQLCPDCAHERRPPNYQVSVVHMLIAGATSLVVSLFMSYLLVRYLGYGFFGFFIAFFLGSIVSNFIVRLLDYLMRAKRGRAIQIATGVGIGLGVFPLIIYTQSLVLLIFGIVTIGAIIAQLR